jgi:hypothetical protein
MVVVPFHALGLRFEEGFGLSIPHHFGHAVIDGPNRSADAAFRDPFPEALRAQIDIDMFVVFAYGAHAHRILLSRAVVKEIFQ